MRPLHLALVLLSATLTASAQTTDPPPPVPTQAHLTAEAPLNPGLPTLFVVGDSTARNGADLGWADHLAPLFDTTKINIANRAQAGRSSRSYYNEGRWDAVVSQLKPGDYVLLQMGHNDGGSGPDGVAKDTKGRSSIKGISEETVEVPLPKPFPTGPIAGQSTETVHTYGWYLRKYIADTRAKGANPILLTVTIRNIWKDGPGGEKQVERDMGFRDFETQVSAAQHVPLADMAALEADYYQKLGPDQTALNFPIDHTHTSAAGADLNAHFVAASLRAIHSPVAAYLKQ